MARTRAQESGMSVKIARLGLKRVTWLTLRRTYSSWAHEKGVPGKVVAQLMGHVKVDTTLNVYTQVIERRTPHGRRQSRIRIVHNCSQFGKGRGAKSLKRLAPQPGLEPGTLRLTA